MLGLHIIIRFKGDLHFANRSFLMQKNLMEKYPEWCNDNEKGKWALCLTDDIDSLMSSNLLTYIKGYDVQYFYDFNRLFSINISDNKKAIGVDMAIENGMCWDNHVTQISRNDYTNPHSANINAITGINQSNYFKKYAGSTLLQIWAYYNVPLPKSEEGKMILLAIDSSFKGLYDARFRSTQIDFLEMMEMDELIDMADSKKIGDFYDVIKKYKLSKDGKIYIDNDGKLKSNLPLQEIQKHFDFPIYLPEQQFHLHTNFSIPTNGGVKLSHQSKKPDGLFSFALTNRFYAKYTYLK